MPPNFKFTKEKMIQSALEIVRKNGMEGVTARALAAKLGCSVKPIFGLFQNMEELQQEVLDAAKKMYRNYLSAAVQSDTELPYKAVGIAYIRFAKEEREVFKLLFMRDRSSETISDDREELKPFLDIIQKNIGLSEEDAYMFHLEMWICVHGIATMVATSYLDWQPEAISKILTDTFVGLKHRYCADQGEKNGCD